jgi:alpha,alpha-trehalose phosphorylase
MIRRRIVPPPEHIYPPDPWRIIEARYSQAYEHRAETAFALSNGYLGVRGTFDEGRPVHSLGTFINGLHESRPIHYAEEAYGLASTGQTMIAVPDATVFRLYVDDEPFFLPVANCRAYRRELDMRAGVLCRDLVWSTPGGKHVRIRSSRLVSLDQRHLLAIDYQITMLDHSAPIAIRTGLTGTQNGHNGSGESGVRTLDDPRLAKVFEHQVLCEELRYEEGRRLLRGYRTANSGMTLCVGADHIIETSCPYEAQLETNDSGSSLLITTDARPSETIRITKYVAYHSSRGEPVTEIVARSNRTLDRAVGRSYEQVASAQRHELDRAWERADVKVEIDAPDESRVQQAVRWNLFQLIQASWHAEGTGIPAKGLTSQTYEGHYFWDTEIYVLPFLAYTQPRIARNLLRFRYSMLDRARSRARAMNHRGALFPWRTINGEEASANFQSGTAQYHINADIAYSVRQYVSVRGDTGFLAEAGAELLVETARLWEDLGFYDPVGAFHIHGVTGPDEYTTLVNDNTYTNLMARQNLTGAAQAVRQLQVDDPGGYVALCHRCRLQPGEIEAWERAAAAMFVPYNARLGINPQDEAFLDREVWDLDSTPPDQFPLLLHFHPLVIYRYQVLKQADIVLAMFLLGDQFTSEQKKRNFDYYDPLTTGDSSLSAGIQSIVAAEIGREEDALSYLAHALAIDLTEISESAPDGVHIASAGSAWMALVFGFGGVRDRDGHLVIDPHLPAAWRSLEFSLRFHDRQIRIALTHDREEYNLIDGDPLEIIVRDQSIPLTAGCPNVMDDVDRVRAQGMGS